MTTHLTISLNNRKRIFALENPPKQKNKSYEMTILLTRLGIAEQNITKLSKKIMVLERQLPSIETDIQELQEKAGVSF